MTGPTLAAAPALRALSVGEILDASFTVYRKHFGVLAVIVIICRLAPMLLGIYMMAAGGPFANLGLWIVYGLLSIILGAIATAATVFVVSENYLGHTISASEAFHRATPRMGSVIACSIMLSIVVVLGLLLLIVPGIIWGCGLVLAIPAVVLEPRLTASTAFSRSWALTKDSKGRMFALVLTSIILIYVPAAAIQGVFSLFGVSGGWGAVSVAEVVGSLAQTFLSPLIYCVLTVAYYDLRVRKEGFDLELLAASLQPA